MGKTIHRTSNVRSDIIYRASLLVAVAGLIGGLYVFQGPNAALTLIFSLGMALGGALMSLSLLSMYFGHKTEIQAAFDFGAAVARQKTDVNFKYEIAGLIYELTGHRTEVVGDSNEGGVDIKVYDAEGQLVGIVQCKNLPSHKITHPAFIRDLNTLRNNHQVKTAYLVSKGRFSEESQKLAEQMDIKLIDGSALVKLRRQAV